MAQPVTAKVNHKFSLTYESVFFAFLGLSPGIGLANAEALQGTPDIVRFTANGVALGGELYKPQGAGPFPAVLWNHGSAPGMLNSQAAKLIGPLFVAKGWVFFMPYRRGQGLSSKSGAYIGDEIDLAEKQGGLHSASVTMTRLLETEQLADQMAGLSWLRSQKTVRTNQIAVAGNSFGGTETVLGAATGGYCAAVVVSGGAESWSSSPELQTSMKAAARKSNTPMLFIQAANDFNLAPSRVLDQERRQIGKSTQLKIYPAFGTSPAEGHSFAYRGSTIWFPDVYRFITKSCRES